MFWCSSPIFFFQRCELQNMSGILSNEIWHLTEAQVITCPVHLVLLGTHRWGLSIAISGVALIKLAQFSSAQQVLNPSK